MLRASKPAIIASFPILAVAMPVELREITRATLRSILKLDAGDGGRQVAPNAISIAEAHFCAEAWFRAIYDGDEPVGFVMLYDPTLGSEPEEREFFLWRLMIDQRHQGRGYGRAAVERLVAHVRTRPDARRLLVSHVRDADRLARFYGSLGFAYTGDEDDGELIMELKLA